MHTVREKPESGRRRLHQNADGQATVEFVLTALFLILLIFGILELMLMIHAYNVLADAAKEGLRYAVVHGASNGNHSGPTCPCVDLDGPPAPPGTYPGNGSRYGVIKTYAQYSFHDTSAMTVTVDYNPGGNNGGAACNNPSCLVRITVSYPYQPFFNLGWPTVTLNAAAQGRIMN
jgi:TadE-like protein